MKSLHYSRSVGACQQNGELPSVESLVLGALIYV